MLSSFTIGKIGHYDIMPEVAVRVNSAIGLIRDG